MISAKIVSATELHPGPHSNKQNLISIDILRAFAALGVFYYHSHIGMLLAKFTGIKWLALTDIFGANYAVPLFFLLSGYCIHLSNLRYLKAGQALPLSDYFQRRLLRIYPAYLAALLFSILVNYIVGNRPVVKTDIITHVLLLQGLTVSYFNTINVVLWTISIELLLYLLYPIFYYLRLKFSLKYALALVFIISGISIYHFSSYSNITLPQRYAVFNIWFAWCCGAFLADKVAFSKTDLTQPVYKLIYAGIITLFLSLKIFNNPTFTIIDYQLNILIWTAPLLLLIKKEEWFAQSNSPLLKGFAAVGLSSYSLYLFHQPLIELKNFVAHKFLLPPLQPYGVLIGLLAIPVVTWFSYLYI